MKREPSSVAIGFGLCAITAIVVTPLCGHWFSCGCDWPWDRFFMACDALARNAPLPHCPWCVHPLAAVASVSLSLGTATLAALNTPHLPAKPVDTLYRLGIGTAISVGVLCLGAWLTALATGHPGFGGASLH